VKLEEYRKRLIELESLPWNESYRKIASRQAEYLSGQAVPDALDSHQVYLGRSTARGIAEPGCFCKIGGLHACRSL
jgi:hypothetical protein